MNFGYGFDPTYIFIVPAIILSLYAQYKVNSAFNKFSKIRNSNNYTGYQVARVILDSNGLQQVPVEMVAGELTDHYDPRTRVLRLSKPVYASGSLAAAGIAAHECGHAIQHSESYMPLMVRNTIAPVASFGSQAAWFLIIGGFIFSSMNLLDIGILLFTVAVFFQIITLPVEFNASKRAITLLASNGLVSSNEIGPAKKVLDAAALTYVAAAATAILQLVRLLVLRNQRD